MPKLATAARVLCLALPLFLAPAAVAEQPESGAKRSPVFPSTPLSPYYDFKEDLHDRTGFSWLINYSIITQGRVGNPFGGENYNANGQLDLIGSLDLDFRRFGEGWGQGRAVVYYMNIHLIGGLTTTQFSTLNGNITPINDSDPAHFLRQAYYRHDFLEERLSIMGGQTEPVLIFGDNRYAIDDRDKFMVVPMATVGAKDRVVSSPGGLVILKLLPWFHVGGSVNQLDPTDSSVPVPPELVDVDLYAIANITFDFEVPRLGRGIYRINGIFTGAQGPNGSTEGIALSFDQDLGSRWGAFFRYDDTEFQTLTSSLSRTLSFGLFHRSPFGREADRFGVGAFQSLSEEGGDFAEWGSEVFYKFGLTRWCDLTLNLQVFDAAKSSDTFATMGGRVFFRF
ncbi:MAG: hypothetical protein ACR2QM_03495 [Longimicrobiales bacterium]